MRVDYLDFLSRRRPSAPTAGIDIVPDDLHPSLFPFQREATRLALQRGRAALFEDTGLGKSRQILEWMRIITQATGRKALLLTPLAVAHQFVETEAPALGLTLTYARSQSDADAAGELVVTNYEMAAKFDPTRFVAVALDEADIISNYVGKTSRLLTEMFRDTPYRLVATATPAPNDLIELGRYSQFLGIMDSGEMLTRYFIRDSQSAASLRLRHWAAAGPFWDWLVSWALCLGLPSDLGPDYDDSGYLLPPLTIEQHMVNVDYSAALEQGQLFPDSVHSATGIWKVKKETLDARCELTAALVARKIDTPWVVWCETDDESRLLARLIPDAVEVRGSHKPEEKERRLRAFSEGRERIIITKPKIAGMGLNWQHCADMVYCSPTFSFKYFYQGLRRIYRFRQERPVTCHVVIAETEENVIAAVERKQRQHRQIHEQARAAMRRRRELGDDWRITTGELRPIQVPAWLRKVA
jgi:hypothetical protein